MKKLKRGIAQITDATVAYGIVAVIVVSLLIPLTQWASEEYRMNIAAGQANTVQKAVNRYISDRQSVIAAGSSATSGYVLTVPMLVTAGYLPDGFAATNAYTATYRTLIFQPTANKFHTMTFLSGGTKLSLSDARKLANRIGVSGGYLEGGVAKGALGSWQENLSAFGGFNPGDGSVVIAGFYANGALVNDYLYRHSVAGHPELNTMGTTLNMGGNDVSNAKTVSGQTLNASGDVNTARLTASQSIQSNGTITANGVISSRSNITATGNVTAGTDVTANGTLRGKNDLILGGVAKLQEINREGTSCDTWGAISRDNVGAILSCQSGVWEGAKQNGSYNSIGTFTGQYNGSNPTTHTITVYVSGGSSTVDRGIDDGSCLNTWGLNASVNGVEIINTYSWNTGWSKRGFISLQVPAKTSYRIVSNPLPSEGCSPGYFYVSEYR